MVGEEHTVLLTQKINNVITMGDNEYNQCSVELIEDIVITPHILSKTSEIGIKENDYIKRVIALSRETIIIVI